MQKVFDSVGLEILEKALKKIKLPENITRLILSLYKERKIKVITSFRLTNEFKLKTDLIKEK